MKSLMPVFITAVLCASLTHADVVVSSTGGGTDGGNGYTWVYSDLAGNPPTVTPNANAVTASGTFTNAINKDSVSYDIDGYYAGWSGTGGLTASTDIRAYTFSNLSAGAIANLAAGTGLGVYDPNGLVIGISGGTSRFDGLGLELVPVEIQEPIQHLDAAVTNSVTGSPVTQWTDLSGNTNHAASALGYVNYPSTSLSATAYFFAKNLYLNTGVPVGLINASWGAHQIMHFIAPEGVAAVPELAGLRQQLVDGPEPTSPQGVYFDVYNSMIHPLVPYGIRGFVWYQCEWDTSSASNRQMYHQKMRALMAGWREIWGQGDLPFYYVQLPTWEDTGTNGAFTRESQLFALSETNAGMAVTIDAGAFPELEVVSRA